jgi:transcriptional regulator with XRE-family HTH domain
LRSPLRPSLAALGRAINFFRLDGNLTQRQVADRSGKHLTYISRLEKGRANPTYETLQDVAKGLGVTFAQIESLAGVYAQREKR